MRLLLLTATLIIACGDKRDDDDDGNWGSDTGSFNNGDEPDVDTCTRWNTVTSSVVSPSWTGDASDCIPGQMGAAAQESVLELTNLYRWMAGVDPVVLSHEYDQALQECAVMMHARGSLSHTPPSSWPCFTEAGANAAYASNLSWSNGVESVASYIIDSGNETTMGHRRWILSDGMIEIGVGSTSSFSCMMVAHGNGEDGWIAFPSPGEFPLQAFEDPYASWTINQTGWSIQFNGISGANGDMEISVDGAILPVNVRRLESNFGSDEALNAVPIGWQAEAGVTYDVVVTGLSEDIAYSVEVVDCSAP